MAASVMLTDDLWWIAGGLDAETNSTLRSTIQVNSDLEVTPGPDMPLPLRGHCLQRLNETHVSLNGGHHGSTVYFNRTYLFEWENGLWTRLPDFNHKRANHACGVAGNKLVREPIHS